MAGLVLTLAAAQGWLSSLFYLDWGKGAWRGLILAGLLLGLVLLRFRPRAASGRSERADAVPHWLQILVALGLLGNLLVAGSAVVISATSNRIAMDEGQMTWRAARLLWRGENPYGVGAVVDYDEAQTRVGERLAAGIPQALSGAALDAALARYDETLDPDLRQHILPVPADGRLAGAAALEARLVGYKYGPVLVMLAAPFAPLGRAVAVVLLNAVACLGLFWVLWRLMRGVGGGTYAAAGLLALLLDRHISWNYLDNTATDIYPLLFGALAVLAFRANRPMATAAALALAVGSKIFPGLLLLPLLLYFRSPRPIVLFIAILAVLYLPWLVLDPASLVDNLVVWPMLMHGDNTSWVAYGSPAVVIAARVLAMLVIGLLWLRFLLGWETRLFWTLAVVSTALLLTGSVFHNNYVPWASIWVVAAIVEAFAARAKPGNSQIVTDQAPDARRATLNLSPASPRRSPAFGRDG